MNAPSNDRSVKNLSAIPLESATGDLILKLKAKMGKRLTREFGKTVPGNLIGRALNEAIETALTTDFPHLFFPALAEEKVRLVSTAITRRPAYDSFLQHAA